jgi:hypothetical protein
MLRIVSPHGTLAHAAEQIPERLVAEKIQPLLRHFKLNVARRRRLVHLPHPRLPAHAPLLLLRRLLAQIQKALFHQTLDQLI